MRLEAGMAAAPEAWPVRLEDLEGRVDSFILDRMGRLGREFVIREVRPALTWNRLDLAIKLFFLEQTGAGPSAFAEELYDAHIHAFSLGDFREPGNSEKRDAASFRSAFGRILRSMRTEGFDPARSLIPAASDGSLINGGHRAACAMFLQQPIHVVETGLPPVRYDHRFFRDRGMDGALLEATVVKYAERSPRAGVALLAGLTEADEKLLGPLVYRKAITLSPNGLDNLLAQVKGGEEWGRAVRSAPRGSSRHRLGRGRDEVRFTACVFERLETEPRGSLQERGETPDHGAPAMFLPDCREGALDLARLLLNDCGLAFLDRASPARFPSTSRLAGQVHDALEHIGVEPETVILGPDMVLAAHGIREARKADVLAPLPLAEGSGLPDIVIGPSGAELLDVLQDPRRHFHHWGLKFLAVSEAIRVVASRESSDRFEMLQLLEMVMPSEAERPWSRELARAARLRWARLRRSAIRTLMRLGLRDQAKRAYDLVRRRR